MNKTYNRINWENYPSDATPINEKNLNKIDLATDEIDNRVITLDTIKATKEEIAMLVQDIEFDEDTGIFSIKKKNGSILNIDTKMEKIAVNFTYDQEHQQIVLDLIDGTKQYIDLSALITQYEFLESETVGFAVDSSGKVSAIIKEGSIEEKHLRPDYLADIRVEVEKAKESQSNAAKSAIESESWAHGGTNTRPNENIDNARYYYEQSKSISESFSGALRPMGTITFENLPNLSDATEGDMYNVSNQFTTTSSFKEGEGNVVPAGANVYKTSDGYWDILAGSPVTGVKGAKEDSYRIGNVNLTPQNIGALPEDGNAVTATKAQQDAAGRNIVDTYLEKTGDTEANTVTFISGDSASAAVWSDIPVLSSGERHRSIFEKLSIMLKNVRYLYANKSDINHTHMWGTLPGTPSVFPPAPHVHDYLPLSGGTVNGNLAVLGGLSSDKYYTATPGRTMVFESGGFINIQVGQSAQVRNQTDTGWAAISAREFVQQSSKRYKENIEDMTEEYAKKLLELRPVSYDYKNKEDGVGCYGLIAEEVDTVESYPVYYNNDHTPEGIDYSKFVPQIIKLLQMHERELEKLKENR